MVTTYKAQRDIVIAGGAYDGLSFMDCENVTITGASFVGLERMVTGEPWVPGEGYGLNFTRCKNVTVKGCDIGGFKVGIVVSLTRGFKIVECGFDRHRADGIDVACSWEGLIEGCNFRDPRIVNGVHPDPIQLWSRATAAPTSDIVIRKNRIAGDWQGISAFNHVRSYKAGTVLADGRVLMLAENLDDGGFDRITIEGNEVEVGYPQAISAMSARDSIVRNNHVRTLPGSKYRASINTGPGVLRYGNICEAGGRPAKVAVIDP